MKKVHFVEIKVFDKENRDLKPLFGELTGKAHENKALDIEILPANHEFPEDITVATLKLEKSAENFLKKILKKVQISDEHVDEKAMLYIRLDKNAYFEHKQLKLTESGDCIHIKANLAAYPAKKEKGIEVLHSL